MAVFQSSEAGTTRRLPRQWYLQTYAVSDTYPASGFDRGMTMLEVPVWIALLFALAVGCALLALGQLLAARRHWRAQRHLASLHRTAWALLFLLAALLGVSVGLTLRGYRLLGHELPVATIQTRQIGAREFAVRVDLPDGTHHSGVLRGDEWQLDARLIQWSPRMVGLGAKPLYRLDRLASRYRAATEAATTPPSVLPLGGDSFFDLWHLKREFPAWLPGIAADYGSAAYLPLLDGASFRVTLSPIGGLIARPADASTVEKLRAAGW
jgi:hypothetical protein